MFRVRLSGVSLGIYLQPPASRCQLPASFLPDDRFSSLNQRSRSQLKAGS
jgi:hypothetical protein